MVASVHSLWADTPERSAFANTKQSGSAVRPCHGCRVSAQELHKGAFDTVKNKRMMATWRAAAEEISSATTAKRQAELSTTRGVVVPTYSNPLENVHFDKFYQIPVDIFHQDAIVSRPSSLITQHGFNFVLLLVVHGFGYCRSFQHCS